MPSLAARLTQELTTDATLSVVFTSNLMDNSFTEIPPVVFNHTKLEQLYIVVVLQRSTRLGYLAD